MEDPGLLPWAQEPGSHKGPQSLLRLPGLRWSKGPRGRVSGTGVHMRSLSSLFLALPPFFLS